MGLAPPIRGGGGIVTNADGPCPQQPADLP